MPRGRVHLGAVIRIETHYDIPFPRTEVWPVLSKTDWINRSMGLPPVRYEFAPAPGGGSVVTGHSRLPIGGMRWREFPFEWREPDYYVAHRVFESGPFTEARLGLDLHDSGTGTHVVCFSEMEPRNRVASWLIRHVIGPKADRDMRRIVNHVTEYLRGRESVVIPKLPTHAPNEAALAIGLEKLRAAGEPEPLIERLTTLLREAPDVEVAHLRPLAFARRWESDPWAVVALFLQATRSGLLDLSWEILCPNCRSTRTPADSLRKLRRTAHCDVCQIEFDAQFDRSVELKFAVNAAVRPREAQTFCLSGPGGTPHVVGQLWLEPGEERRWKWPQPARSLRLRSPQVAGAITLEAAEGATTAATLVITAQAGGFTVTREAGEPEPSARVVNPNPFPVQLSFENIGWGDDILTAARATNLQEFRDLFSAEVVSPSEEITVGAQVVLFTDLRGSTALYHGLGDAPAYARVRDHFSVISQSVARHHGTVVKTIGDAVMGTFSRADEALAAVREMHRALAISTGGEPLVLKSGLHVGPCLAVNANERLDFFGTTINLASRMVGCCHGGDLTVSDELFRRPEMMPFLENLAEPPEPLEVRFRGFDSPHLVWRLAMT
jgi:class 3 adenylate cyclase